MATEQHKLKRNRQRGYTLGELITTMGVVGILAAVAIPSMQSMVSNNRRVTATNDMSYSIQLARSEAIARNQQVRVCPSSNGTSCNATNWNEGWIIFNDIDQSATPNGDERILLKVEGPDFIDIYTATFADSFTYRPNGRIMGEDFDANTGQFTICDSRGAEQARVLIIAASGRPRVSESQADGSDPNCS
jgi:type IV fimbrial biogenesis protein FimT